MADNSPIEWTDATWQPITGCSIVSPGCTNCYAMKLAGTRLRHHPSRKGLTQDTKAGPVWTGEVRFNEQWLLQPFKWKRPRRVFVCAHSDLFAENVPDEWIDKVFAVMALAPQHTFQVLTKRAKRMREYWDDRKPHARIADQVDRLLDAGLGNGDAPARFPIPNVWLGVSTERQQEADERIPLLLQTPAAVRFISAEPLLGPISFRWAKWDNWSGPNGLRRATVDHLDGARMLDWVIAGGESGPDARPMHPDWARLLREECSEAGVPFFFKQWGEWTEWPDADFTSEEAESLELQNRYEYFQRSSGDPMIHVRRVGKKAAGRLLDGVEHNAMPEVARS